MNLRDWTRGLYGQHGELTPEIVKEAARAPDSPAHGFVFHLAPAEAAEEWYTHRAHRLIQLVRVTYRPQPEAAPRRVRVWHAIVGENSATTYAPLDVILAHPDKLVEARAAAVKRLREAEAAVEELDAISTDRMASSAALAAIRSASERLAAAAD